MLPNLISIEFKRVILIWSVISDAHALELMLNLSALIAGMTIEIVDFSDVSLWVISSNGSNDKISLSTLENWVRFKLLVFSVSMEYKEISCFIKIKIFII